MFVKKSFKINLAALLLAVMLVSPTAASAYGGGFPPIVVIGPRIENARVRLAHVRQRLADRVQALRERIFSRFPGFPIAEL